MLSARFVGLVLCPWRLFVFAIGGSSSRAVTENFSEVVTETDNSNLAVQTEEGPALGIRGDENVVNVTDAGAIERAFQFGESALDLVEAQGSQAIEATTANLQEFAARSVESVRDIAERTTATESDRVAGLVQTGILALAAVFALRIWRRA